MILAGNKSLHTQQMMITFSYNDAITDYNNTQLVTLPKIFCSYIRASVDALSRDGTDMRGDVQNPNSTVKVQYEHF